jgi:uncharacterized membrane protein
MSMLKTTITGGFVFLLPIVILVVILGYALNLVKRMVAPMEHLIPQEFDSIAGVATINILAFIAVLVLCFLAGLVARSQVAANVVSKLEEGLLTAIPGYAFIKAITASFGEGRETRHMLPSLVRLDDQTLVGFEVERTEDGRVVVYLPGSPDPSSGAVAVMEAERVQRFDAPVAQTMRSLRKLGRGSAQVLGG